MADPAVPATSPFVEALIAEHSLSPARAQDARSIDAAAAALRDTIKARFPDPGLENMVTAHLQRLDGQVRDLVNLLPHRSA